MSRLVAPCLALSLASCAGHGARQASASFSAEPTEKRLVLLHVSDIEAEIVPAVDRVGGLGRFAALVEAVRGNESAPTLMLAAGDTFMPAPALQLELDGVNAVSLANDRIGLQASALGNHEFDRGEGFLAEMIARASFPYLTATVDFRNGPVAPLAVHVGEGEPSPWLERNPGRVLPRGTICAGADLEKVDGEDVCRGLTVGVIGATTETLATVASTEVRASSVTDFAGVVRAVQAQADALRAEGVDVVILLSHLQDVRREIELVDAGLVGVDVIVGGGGDDRLANRGDRLHPGDEPSPVCTGREPCYPVVKRARDGSPVLVLATDGAYRYLGRIGLSFDRRGVLTGFEAGARPLPVDDRSLTEAGAVADGPAMELERRVRAALEPLSIEVARSSVYFDGDRENVRNRQTNLGDISADAIAWVARRDAHGVTPAFALRNGGGIRSSIGGVDHDTFARHGGPIRLLDIEAALRFDNPIVLVTTSHRALKETLEAGLRGVGTSRGHFPQVSAEVFLAYDPAGVEQVQEPQTGPGSVLTPGGRVRTLRVGALEIVRDGVLLDPDRPITFATLDYLARGGDGWFPTVAPIAGAAAVLEGAERMSEQRALRAYLRHLVLAGTWSDGNAYVDPAPDRPDTFTRIRPLDQ